MYTVLTLENGSMYNYTVQNSFELGMGCLMDEIREHISGRMEYRIIDNYFSGVIIVEVQDDSDKQMSFLLCGNICQGEISIIQPKIKTLATGIRGLKNA